MTQFLRDQAIDSEEVVTASEPSFVQLFFLSFNPMVLSRLPALVNNYFFFLDLMFVLLMVENSENES